MISNNKGFKPIHNAFWIKRENIKRTTNDIIKSIDILMTFGYNIFDINSK